MTLSDTDRIELQALLMRYTHILDYGNVDDLDTIWTADSEFQVDEPPFHMQGLDQIKQTLRGTRNTFPHVRHVVSNCYVDAQGDDACVMAYLQIVDTREMKATVFARYIDRCVRTPQGWRIRSRQCISG